ncbi:MAG: T9SS type A sorting domain-containing protein [Cyclobacteriaceae bacterium]|nr:T9SS type A sorting domain-containing protein [Cyclobacteriaceae bacterium]
MTNLTTIVTGHTVTLDIDGIILSDLTVENEATLTDISTLNYVFAITGQLNVYGTVNMTTTSPGSVTNARILTIYATGSFTCRKIIYDIANNYGTARIANQFQDSSNPTTPWVNQANSTLFIGDASALSKISASTVGNTVNYNSSSGGQQIIAPIDSYYNLTSSNGGNKTLTSNTSVLGNLLIAGSASFRLSSFNLYVAGDWNNSSSNGTAFSFGTGTVTLNGSTIQNIINTGHASGTRFNGLIIANTSASTPQINMLADVRVASTLTMTSGVVNLNSSTFQLGTSNAAATTLNHSGAASSGWFYNGDFARYFVTNATIPNGSNDGFFPVGTSSNFRPFYVSSTTELTGLPIATVTCPPSASTYSRETIPDIGGTISKVALSGWSLLLADGTGGSFSVNAGGTGIGIIGDVNDLRLTQISSAAGTPGVNTSSPTFPMVERTGLTATDLANIIFYVGSVDLTSSPLPVELISFSGEAESSLVNLHWQTRSELNSDYFTVYRSSNGKDFVRVGTIKGQGTTKLTTNYELQDKSPLKGINYYRLSQTDWDGSTHSLSLISVEANGVEAIQIYPNPVKAGHILHIHLQGASQIGEQDIQVINAIGQVVGKYRITFDENGGFSGDLKMEIVPSGLYFIRINQTQLKLLIE